MTVVHYVDTFVPNLSTPIYEPEEDILDSPTSYYIVGTSRYDGDYDLTRYMDRSDDEDSDEEDHGYDEYEDYL